MLQLLHDLGEQKSATPAQISLAWMICKKPYIVLIPGTRKTNRLIETAKASEVVLTKEEVRRLDDALHHMKMSDVFGGSRITTK